ncbi:hypothetical protein [uncultured Oscillibacter sp.]|uniref:hypothetical protein n=1 Tax=uncultured Oscillibacter sp. TaxID=876091 RepID=UPI0025F9CBC5|nr:hypothetical protein [uncultured Oscillibacter sp.]
MFARNETILKWALYAAAALACILFQGAVLQRVTLWGVIPFLYPALAVVPATYEGPVPGTAFALGLGVVCDLLLPGAFPCFYTLVFPLAGLCAGLLAQGVLRAGFLCSLVSTAAAFLLTGLGHCLLLWIGGKAAWGPGAFLALREFCVTAPLSLPLTALFRRLYRRTHRDD